MWPVTLSITIDHSLIAHTHTHLMIVTVIKHIHFGRSLTTGEKFHTLFALILIQTLTPTKHQLLKGKGIKRQQLSLHFYSIFFSLLHLNPKYFVDLWCCAD